MRRKTKEYIILSILLLLTSCGGSKVMRELSDIESYIDARPDSALVAIRQIDTLSLKTKAQKAKFALLHAMALDKNYIDTADTRIIQPAVDYYNLHGGPEERLKAYYYQGREYYNEKQYNQAIISFTQAKESVVYSKDNKIIGMLYSALADTYTKTLDYSQASEEISKAIEYFTICEREDFLVLARLRKAQNLTDLKKWNEAKEYYETLLPEVKSPSLKAYVESCYALLLATQPEHNDSLALVHFSNAIQIQGKLGNYNQYGAYAYTLNATGKSSESDSIMNILESVCPNDYSYKYWKHRLLKDRGDFKNAYLSLYEAMRISDSLNTVLLSNSAATTQRVYMDKQLLEKEETNKRLIRAVVTSFFLIAFIALISVFLMSIRRRKIKEERNRALNVIDNLKLQVETLKDELLLNKNELSGLTIKTHKAKFQYLASLYEIIHQVGNDDSDLSIKRIYRSIQNRVSDLNDNPESQRNFEKLLNQESDDIMAHFRNDFPNLSPRDYRLASYVFAGFDNTTLSLLLDLEPSHTRVLKGRLRARISNSDVERKDDYDKYFHKL